MDQLLAQLRGFLAKYGFVLAVTAVTLVTVIDAARIAIPARKQKKELVAESAKLEALIASSNLCVSQFQPATNEESAIWQNTDADFQALGVKPSERLTLAEVVSRRADEAGYTNTHIKFVPADPATSVAARQAAGITFNLAQYKLEVTGGGSFAELAALLGILPPAVELQSVSMARDSAMRVNTSITLSVFEPAGGNGK